MLWSLLLVHSPLLGPSSWRPFAALARELGLDLALPDLTDVVSAAQPHWRHFVRAAAEAGSTLTPPTVVVGHSGAGVFLPAIARHLDKPETALTFVDAVVPPQAGAHTTPPRMAEMLDRQSTDGVLAQWLDWWPEDIVEELLPDPADWDTLRADMPQLPRAFYDEAVPVPEGWSDGRCCYLRLSAAYDGALDTARELRWPTASLDSSHLSIYRDPRRVLDTVVTLAGQLRH